MGIDRHPSLVLKRGFIHEDIVYNEFKKSKCYQKNLHRINRDYWVIFYDWVEYKSDYVHFNEYYDSDPIFYLKNAVFEFNTIGELLEQLVKFNKTDEIDIVINEF